jgi:hypothetical protein
LAPFLQSNRNNIERVDTTDPRELE